MLKNGLYSLLVMLLFCGCKINYSFTGASIAPDVKTVSVLFFQNNAPLAQPTISQAFTESLKDIFVNQTSLSLVSRSGDLNFEGAITGYSTTPVSLQQTDNVVLNRLTITVTVKFTNTKDEKQNFESSFSRFADYNSSVSFASIENQLIKQINDQLVQDIFNKAVTNW